MWPSIICVKGGVFIHLMLHICTRVIISVRGLLPTSEHCVGLNKAKMDSAVIKMTFLMAQSQVSILTITLVATSLDGNKSKVDGGERFLHV